MGRITSLGNDQRQEGLFELQLGLLSNGFALLKEGGSLVYATCSLCQRQNEDVAGISELRAFHIWMWSDDQIILQRRKLLDIVSKKSTECAESGTTSCPGVCFGQFVGSWGACRSQGHVPDFGRCVFLYRHSILFHRSEKAASTVPCFTLNFKPCRAISTESNISFDSGVDVMQSCGPHSWKTQNIAECTNDDVVCILYVISFSFILHSMISRQLYFGRSSLSETCYRAEASRWMPCWSRIPQQSLEAAFFGRKWSVRWWIANWLLDHCYSSLLMSSLHPDSKKNWWHVSLKAFIRCPVERRSWHMMFPRPGWSIQHMAAWRGSLMSRVHFVGPYCSRQKVLNSAKRSIFRECVSLRIGFSTAKVFTGLRNSKSCLDPSNE